MGEAATRGEGRVRQIVTAADTLVAALNRNTQATDALTAKMTAMEAASTKAGAAVATVATAADTAASNVVKFTGAASTAKPTLDNLAAAARQATSAWAALGAAGADTAQKLEIARRMASASAVIPAPTIARVDMAAGWAALSGQGAATASGLDVTRRMAMASASVDGLTKAANSNARAVGLSANELRNLSFQLNDVATMALSGASAFQIAATQGGQFLQIGQQAGGGLKGIFTQAGEAASNLAGRVGLVGGALGAVGIALATATAATINYNAQQKELARTTFGAGRASGATLDTLNDAANRGAAGGTISVSASQEVVAQLNASGKIDPRVYADVSANARDLAKLLGTDIPGATETVTSALAGGVQGFDRLNASLGLGGAAMREQIKDLYESGRAYEAQRIIVDAYAKRVAEFSGQKGFFERLGERFDFGRNTSNELSMIGGLFGGTTSQDQQLAAARKRLAGLEYQRDAGLGFNPSEMEGVAAEIAKIEASIKSAADKGKEAKTALVSLTVQPLIDSLNPAAKRIDDLKAQAQSIAKYLAEGGIDKDGSAKRTMDGLNAQAKLLAEDLARGGTALADSLRRAQFDATQVGRSALGRSSADVAFNAAEERRKIEEQNLEPRERNQQLNAIATRERLQQANLSREATISETQRSGLLNRVPANLRQYYVDAAKQTGVPLDFLLGTSYVESGFSATADANKNDPRSHAYGPMQLQPGTARQLGVDPRDPAQNILGGARYLRDRLDQANGDEALAYGLYHDGPNSSGNSAAARAAYARIQRFRNMPTTGQEVVADDSRSRALENENRLVQINSQFLGRNGEALEAATREQQLLNEAISQGREITPQLRGEIARTAAAMASATRSLVGTRAGSDLAFERDQLGRDRYDQAAFARARSTFGDVTSPQATAYIAESRQNAMLSDARATATDAFTGFATALAHGTSAASAFGNALSRIGDKLLGGVIDSLIGSAFKGGGGGLLSMFGFADGGFTGYGGRNQPAGIVHAGEVVFSQSDVARFGGPHVVNAMRLGYPGYADGGPVLPMMPNLATLPTMPDAPANMNGAMGPQGPTQLNVNVTGANGDKQIMSMVQMGVGSALAQYDSGLKRNISGIVAAGQRRYGTRG